jgi:hypothetical protein
MIVLVTWFAFGCSEAPETRESVGETSVRSVEEWESRRRQLESTVWSDETAARHHEQVLVTLWDRLLAAKGDSVATQQALSSVDFETLSVGTPTLVERLDHDVEWLHFETPKHSLAPKLWSELLERLAGRGYELVQSEWHHARFVPPSAAAPARSWVSIVLHVLDSRAGERIVIDGVLVVEWSGHEDGSGLPIPESIDATQLRMLRRSGEPGFRKIFNYSMQRGAEMSTLHPILLYDLDRDGFDDIVSVGGQRVLWNLGPRGFREAPLVEKLYRLTEAGVIADLDGDANPDLLASRGRGDLALYHGNPSGRFRGEPSITEFDEPLLGPSVLSVGDIDGDGDLDVWLGQYKPPYARGQMPTPYYDANDGHPAYLLINDGDGRLTDATEASGLAAKRFRRMYASSLVDLDEDGDLDLLVVSDFAGIDLYANDGSGHFTDMNDTVLADRHLFGMSASFADFDLDGRLDFFVAGMASTTARRLEALGLSREQGEDERDIRMRMAFGNRMYLSTNAGWAEPEFSTDVARTGWTWGTTALDFDNDGDPDIFAANGHKSGESTQDYCSTFWTHDIYDGDSTPSSTLASVFDEATAGLSSGQESWDGYQKNHLLMNRNGSSFVNVAFLLGVADEFDSRSAVSTDIDRDGRMDMVVVEDIGDGTEKLHIYRNQLETPNHWIGIQLRDEGGESPLGATVRVRTPLRSSLARVVTGETLMGQHAPTIHFGLGQEEEVLSIEVRWLSGNLRTLSAPAVDRYHLVLGGGANRSASTGK